MPTLELAEIKTALEVFANLPQFREPPAGMRWAVDDLRPCIKHRVKLNHCAACWPDYLVHLGDLCIQYYAFRKQMRINVLGRPA